MFKSKSVSILLVIGLLIGGLPLFAMAQGTVTSLTPPTQTIAVSGTATVTLHVQDVTDLYGFQANLQFNPSLLQVVDDDPITPGVQVELLNSFLHPTTLIANNANNLAGTVSCIAMQTPPDSPQDGSGDLIQITFQGVANGTSAISFVGLSLFDFAGDPITTAQSPAEITVGAPAPTPTPTAAPDPITSTLGTLLKGVAVDPLRNLVYVAVQSDNTVAVVDGLTHALLTKVSSGGVAPSEVALSQGGGKLFVVNAGSNQVAVFDVDNDYDPIGTINVGHKPFGIAIANGIGYVTNFDDGTATVFDVNTLGVIETFWVGHHPALPAAMGDHAYIPIHSAFSRFEDKDANAEWDYVQRNKGTDTGIVILYGDGRPDPVKRVLQEYVGFYDVAVDETHGRIYVTKRDGTAEGLYVLNAVDHGLIQFVPMLRPYGVAVNPITQHVFVVQGDMDEVYVLDGSNGCRLICALNTDPNNGDIPGMHGGQGVAVSGDEAVVANYAAGTLTFVPDEACFNVPVDPEYIRGWQEGGGNHGPLGQPLAPSYTYWYSEQQYERGSLHWRQVPSGPNQVYVFDNESTKPGGTDWMGRDDGIWTQQDDGWHVGLPLFPAGCPQAGWPYGPMFGFGLAWCTGDTTRGKIKTVIGYPIGWEYGTVGGDQAFAGGVVFWNPASDAYYVLRSDNHTWRYFRAHRRYDTGEIAPNIVGQVHLQGRASGQGVSLTSPSGPHTSTREDGSFGLHFLGQADLTFRHPGYLDVVMTVKGSESAVLDAGEIAMVGGDVNGDNRIDILDIAFVGYHFSGTEARADVNGDGKVDILDLSMAGANFGQSGPVYWTR